MRIKHRQAQYRGYRIKLERRDLCWRATLKPIRPELPYLPPFVVSDGYAIRTSSHGPSEAAGRSCFGPGLAVSLKRRTLTRDGRRPLLSEDRLPNPAQTFGD